MSAFVPTHIFTLFDDTEIPVAAELRGDWVAYEADGTAWVTVMGVDSLWWACTKRLVRQIKAVRTA